MKGIALAAALLLLSACDSSQTPSDGAVASDSTVIERIAGDKDRMAELMRISHRKGTLDDALAAAMVDSTIAAAIFDVALNDDRFAVITAVGTPAPAPGVSPVAPKQSSTTPAKKSTTTKPATTTTTPKRSGDVLDDAEETARKANERLEQAERIRREAEEAKRKVEVILGR